MDDVKLIASPPAEIHKTRPPGLGSDEVPETDIIDDESFMDSLRTLRALSAFALQEGVQVEEGEEDPTDLGELNRLRSPRPAAIDKWARSPKKIEWDAVHRHMRLLYRSLTPAQRRRFTMGAVPKILAWLPLFFAVIALTSLVVAIVSYEGKFFAITNSRGANVLPFYLVWLLSLGAIGSVAFIGMNVLSVQEDITFDLTNRQFITLKVVLGALFGLVLTLPFGFNYFLDFCNTIATAVPGTKAENNQVSLTIPAVMLMLPFILGFSTSLVILILNRLVTAVQGFFGGEASTSSAATVQQATPRARAGSSQGAATTAAVAPATTAVGPTSPA